MRTSWIAVPLALAAASCGGADLEAKYAPGFTPGKTTVAVLGVFSDGRLSEEVWATIGGPISAVFGQPICDAAVGARMQRLDPELFASVDEDVRSNGITGALLDRMAPKTDADIILTFSLHGRILPIRTSGQARQARMGRRPHAPPEVPERSSTSGEMELSASFYSVRLRRSVGRIRVRFSGTATDEPVLALGRKLGEEMPGSTCRPWKIEQP